MGRFTQCIDCLITQKHGPSDFLRGIGRSLRLLLSRFRSKDVVLLPFVHLYSTLLPQVVGDRLKPHQTCVTGISPLRGSLRAAPMKMAGQEYHDCLTGSLRDSLVELFCERMGTARHLTLAVFYAGSPHRWVLAHPPESLPAFGGPSGNVFQSPDVQFSRFTGCLYRHP